jgi:hypothetical protein
VVVLVPGRSASLRKRLRKYWSGFSTRTRAGIIAGAVFAVLVMVAAMGYGVWTLFLKPVSPLIETSIAKLDRDYGNAVSGDAKYKGNPVVITGRVVTVGTPRGGTCSVIIKGPSSCKKVECLFDEAEAGKLQIDNLVTVKGCCAGKSAQVTMKKCTVLETKILQLSATDLGREFDDDPKAADEKYEDTALEVSGIVAGVYADARDSIVQLQCRGKKFTAVNVLCRFNDKEKNNLVKLKPGDRVNIRGSYDGTETETASMSRGSPSGPRGSSIDRSSLLTIKLVDCELAK